MLVLKIMHLFSIWNPSQNPKFLKVGDAAIVKIKPIQPMVIERQKEIPQMSRFAIRDSGATVAAGMCIDLVKK